MHTMGRCTKLFFALGLAAWFDGCAGQAFQWKFAGNMVSTTLTQCQSYGITLINVTSNASALGVPPYYLTAFKPSGIPTTSPIGSDPSNLKWQVNQPSGSTLLLSVLDSNFSSGGQPPTVFTVGDGDGSCIPAAPSVNITLVANITKSVETCQPMGFRVYGGQKPYNISLAAVNSPVVTNVTMGPTDDVFTYIDRADPGGQLLVAVSDANGVWGSASELFATTGNTNVTCVGLISTVGNSSTVDQHPTPPSNKSHTTVIVAVVVPIVVLLLLAGAVFFLWRRKKTYDLREPEPAFLPDAWHGPISTTDGASTAYSPYDPPPDSKAARYRDDVAGGRTQSQIGLSLLAPNRSAQSDGASSSGSGSGGGGWGNAPVLSPMRSSSTSKAAQRPHTASSMSSSRLPPGVPQEWGIEQEVVIQHRDAGAVQEIPPPYIDRGSSSGGPSGSGSHTVSHS